MPSVFDISISDEPIPGLDPGEIAVYGTIIIGDFREDFYSSRAIWTRQQYQQHWNAAISRIVAGEKRSALIVSYLEPRLSHSLEWWPLYREADNVYVQNQLLFFDQLSQPFCADRPWDSVRDRQTISSEGQKISKWTTNVDSLCEFLKKRGQV